MKLLYITSALILLSIAANAASPPALVAKCTNELNKVMNCLEYATAKAKAPTDKCCQSVTDISTTDPVCLCYFIVEAHNGNAAIKSLGIQEARLLQLPSSCKLTVSITECPKLLNLPKSSADNAVFTKNASSIATAAANSTSTPSTLSGSTTSMASNCRPFFASSISAIATALFFLCVSSAK